MELNKLGYLKNIPTTGLVTKNNKGEVRNIYSIN